MLSPQAGRGKNARAGISSKYDFARLSARRAHTSAHRGIASGRVQPWRSRLSVLPPSNDSTGSRSKPAHRAPFASISGRRISKGSPSIS